MGVAVDVVVGVLVTVDVAVDVVVGVLVTVDVALQPPTVAGERFRPR